MTEKQKKTETLKRETEGDGAKWTKTSERDGQRKGGRRRAGQRGRRSEGEGGMLGRETQTEGSGGSEGQREGSDIIWSSHGLRPRRLNPVYGLVYLRI